jgi:hypothetical protein
VNQHQPEIWPSVHPHSPLRQPHWRWLLAHAPRRHPALRYADKWVRRARLWVLRRRDKSLLRQSVLRLRADKLLRDYLEAGVPISLLAHRMQHGEDVIGAYIALFFDIAGREKCCDWILYQVVGLTFEGFGYDLGTVWKWFAYQGGTVLFDLVSQGTISVEDRGRFCFERCYSRDSLFQARLYGTALALPARYGGAVFRLFRRWGRYRKLADPPGDVRQSPIHPLVSKTKEACALRLFLKESQALMAARQKEWYARKTTGVDRQAGHSPVCAA